ncbi:MAG: thymidylate kinase [candidate division WS1 bacterium]|nr:thymidylate kinase [candidate division WS1 bacterium]
MKHEYYWISVPGVDPGEPLNGRLIVLEGTDGVGRSTQTRLLRDWLESSGLAVYDTGLRRGSLAGRHIQAAKEGHTMGRRTQCLFYASDFADRLENEIIPALRAGYVVLTDRYIYSLMARAAVRGVERDWLRKLYGFALKPDLVLYMGIALDNLLPRVLAGNGFDYWESGMDYIHEDTMYDAFVTYQRALLAEFDLMAGEYDFIPVDAYNSIREVFVELQQHVQPVVADMLPGQPKFTDFVGPVPPVAQPEDQRSLAETLRDFLSSLLED